MTRSYKILICDDNEFVREILKAFVGDLPNVSCEMANDGKSAMEKLEKGVYDLIIMDLMMPYFSGTELIRMMRVQKGMDTPIIVLTDHHYDQKMLQGLDEFRIDHIVTKPFMPSEINQLISQTLHLNEPVKQ